jgi:hypothetical protein
MEVEVAPVPLLEPQAVSKPSPKNAVVATNDLAICLQRGIKGVEIRGYFIWLRTDVAGGHLAMPFRALL